jgi:hypothetical protein
MSSIVSNVVIAILAIAGQASASGDATKAVYIGPDGRLAYTADEQGNRIPDFSRAGYMGGGVALPEVPTVKILRPQEGSADDTARIQAAIDELSAAKPSEQGTRGALLLARGTYRVSATLRVATSGAVLRGEGQGADGTILLATGK